MVDTVQIQDSGGGIRNAIVPPGILRPMKTLKVRYSSPDNLVAEFPDGTWLGTDNTATGRYQGSYWFGVGDPSSLVKTEKTACRANTLLNKAGVSIGGLGVWGAWILPDNNFLFVVNGSGGKWYLYLAKNVSGTVTVGANYPTLNDAKPVMEIGEKSGTHIAGVNALHKRSLCIANIGGSTVLLFGEYNVASGRVPGGANDLVRLLKSTDLGVTWTTVLEWNTNGSTRQVSHIHGVIQDPLTKYIYILCGDNIYGGLIRWDGISAAPAANTAIVNFNITPGWDCLYDSANLDRYRSGDILFNGDMGGYLIDNHFNKSPTLIPRTGKLFGVSGEPVDVPYGHDPLIGLNTLTGFLWVCLIDRTNFPTCQKTWDVLYSSDLKTWVPIGYFPDYSTSAAVKIFDIYFSRAGEIVISAVTGVTSLVAGSVGGTLLCYLTDDINGMYKQLT